MGKGVLEDTFYGSWTVLSFPARSPTPGRLNLRSEPDPENPGNNTFFGHFLAAFWRDLVTAVTR